jgi:5-methylcytosine-specific restriction protein A
MAWSPNSGGRSVPYRLQQACFKRDRYTCQGCGYEGEPNDGTLHADHIHNRAEGGQDTLDNLATLCTPCHEPKTTHERARGRQRRQGRRRPRMHPADAA